MNKRTRTFGFLPLTLRVESLGGVATPLVLRGTPLPARRSQLFTTATDNQENVEVKVLMGESPIAENNIQVHTFNLTGIPRAARGIPQILVTFEVDQGCNVTASASLRNSDLKVAVEFDDAKLHLTDDEIKRLLQQSEATRAEDETILRLVEAKNKADIAITKAEATLREYQGKGLASEKCERIEKALASLGLALETENVENIRAGVEKLESLARPVGLGDFQSLFGDGDLFSTLFDSQKRKSQHKTSSQESVGGRQRLQGQLVTSGGRMEQIGKIFGGGEFTLDPNLCFVLMPFEEEMRPIFEDHIRIVVESEGLSCLRAEEIVSTNLITWDIWERINRARFLVADLTGKNANVFYEVGLAHALGKEIILLTQTMKDVPFDLKALRCIVYSFTPRGMKEMEAKLRATIRDVIKSP